MSHSAVHTLGRPWDPCEASPVGQVDIGSAQEAARALLSALGVPLHDEAMAQTPRRMAHALAEMLSPPPLDLTTFPNTEDYDELVLVERIPVHSVCEHHVLPFTGVAQIGYLPGDRIL